MMSSRPKLIALAVLAAAYAGFIAWYHAPYAGASDASGYMNSAQLLLSGKLSTPLRLPAGMPADLLPKDSFVPLGFRADTSGDNMVPTYPVGLPLHLVAIAWLTGLPAASTVVGVASALAFMLLLHAVGRDFGLRSAWSAGVAALGALSPLTLMFALMPMSDLLAAVWSLAVILCARRAGRGPGWAVATGAALAVAVLIRPTNLLLAVPAFIALPANPRTWLAFGLGGVPGALFLAWYNHALYGTWFTTGYLGVTSLFGWKHVPATLWHYAVWLPVLASPLVCAAPGLPWLSLERRAMWTLVTWAGVQFLFYAAYLHTHQTWWFLRFVLPGLPALGIAAALVLQHRPLPVWHLASRLLPATAGPDEVARGRILRMPFALVLLLAAAAWQIHWSNRLQATTIELYDRGYPLTGRWSAEAMPADAVLLAYQVSGALLHYSPRPFVVPDWLGPQDCSRLEDWLARNKRPLYAALYPHEEAAVWKKFPGRWEVVARFRQATVWRRVEPAASPP